MTNKVPVLDTEGSRELYEELRGCVVDGVGSSFHKYAGEPYPIAIERAHGSHFTDVDGNDYIDYVLGMGPLILGHSPEVVASAVARQAQLGSLFSAPSPDLLRLSRRLTEIIPCAEMVSYQNTGTESVMFALRLARGYTGKRKIVKFEGHYHGWSDEEKISIDAHRVEELGPRNRPWKLLGGMGQLESSADEVIVLPWNDLDALETCLKRQGNDIAAVIMEPFMCDSGPIFPARGYLEGVRELTRDHDVVLVFDEVITGFRLALGGAQEKLGVTPDVATFAKAIAGGYPLAAICGKREIMSCGVHPSGTFNANSLVVAASLATIGELSRPGVYEGMEELGRTLADGLRKLGDAYGIPLFADCLGALCILEFGFDPTHPLTDLRDCVRRNDFALYDKVYLMMRERGVRLTPRRGRIYLSTAHTKEDIEYTLSAFEDVFSLLGAEARA